MVALSKGADLDPPGYLFSLLPFPFSLEGTFRCVLRVCNAWHNPRALCEHPGLHLPLLGKILALLFKITRDTPVSISLLLTVWWPKPFTLAECWWRCHACPCWAGPDVLVSHGMQGVAQHKSQQTGSDSSQSILGWFCPMVTAELTVSKETVQEGFSTNFACDKWSPQKTAWRIADHPP